MPTTITINGETITIPDYLAGAPDLELALSKNKVRSLTAACPSYLLTDVARAHRSKTWPTFSTMLVRHSPPKTARLATTGRAWPVAKTTSRETIHKSQSTRIVP